MALLSLTQLNLCISWLLSLIEAPQGTSVEGHALQPFSDSFILSAGREGRQVAISVLWALRLPFAHPPLGKIFSLHFACLISGGPGTLMHTHKCIK